MFIDRLAIVVFLALVAVIAGSAHVLVRRMGVREGLPFVTWLVVLFLCLGGIWFGDVQVKNERELYEAQFAGIAPLYAHEMARLGHERIGLDTPPDDPSYLAMIEAQKLWLEQNPAIGNIYTYRFSNGRWRRIVDSETDLNGDGIYFGRHEQRRPIGELLSGPDARAAQSLIGEIITDLHVYEDHHRKWLRVFAPVYDSNGKVDAGIALDVPAEKWMVDLALARVMPMGLSLCCLMATVVWSAMVQVKTQAIRRLKQTRRELEKARVAAESANAAKSSFLANISHEIRTPMTAVLGFTEILFQEVKDPAARAHLRVIQRNGEHLVMLINDLLDLSKIEAGGLALSAQPTNFIEMIYELCKLLRVRIEDKKIEMHVEVDDDVPEWVLVDPLRVQQLLTNLIGNAIKFTHEGSVRVSVARLENDMLQVQVRDTGVGIAPERLEAIFDPFEQADASTTRQFGGTGLGLAISRRLARLMGGDLTVESELGKWSLFTLTFAAPGAEPRKVDPPAEELDTTNLCGSLVLYAEDGPDNQKLISHHLERAGAKVLLADDGVKALEMFKRLRKEGRTPNLVLTDIQMPEMDGLQLTRALREEGCQTPIIALAASVMRTDIERCLQAGCDDCLAKPIRRDVLLEACAKWAARRHRDAA